MTFETTTGSIEIVQLAAGRYHNVALTSSGLVYTWGVGGSGADHLGHAVKDLTENSKQTFTTPQVVDVLLPENGGCRAVYVNVSSNRTCIISKYGDLYTWGSADHNVGYKFIDIVIFLSLCIYE
jgi:alpha-tubulin suppressor-like RCC1 family protein